MAKVKTRKLEDTSWLAQIIQDKMNAEADRMGPYPSSRWNCLHTLHIIVQEADTGNPDIWYDTEGHKKIIVIRNIPSLVAKHGTDFDAYGMQNKLRGLAERYKDDDGMYLVNVKTTHNLNSAVINDVSELLYQMGV